MLLWCDFFLTKDTKVDLKLQDEDKETEETQKKKQQDETAPVMEQNKELKERMKRELVEQRDQLKEQLQKVETEIVSGDKIYLTNLRNY